MRACSVEDRVTKIGLICLVMTAAGFSLGSGTTSAQQVDEIPTLSPSGYAAFHNVNTIQSLSITIFLSDLK